MGEKYVIVKKLAGNEANGILTSDLFNLEEIRGSIGGDKVIEEETNIQVSNGVAYLVITCSRQKNMKFIEILNEVIKLHLEETKIRLAMNKELRLYQQSLNQYTTTKL